MNDITIGQKLKINWFDVDAYPTYEGIYERTSSQEHLIGHVVAVRDDMIIVTHREILDDGEIDFCNYSFTRQDDGSWWTKDDEWLDFVVEN